MEILSQLGVKKINLINPEQGRKLKSNIIGALKKSAYLISWLGIILVIGLILSRLLISERILWLNGINVISFLFILADLVLINSICSRRGTRNESFWFWLLVILLTINFNWGLARLYDESIYKINTSLNYYFVIIGFLLLASIRKKINNALAIINKLVIEDNRNGDDKTGSKIRSKSVEKKHPVKNIPVSRSIIDWFHCPRNHRVVYLTLLFVIILIGSILRFGNLEKESLYHDQLIQYQAIEGAAEHGKAAIYNPITKEYISPYSRASLLTYTSAHLLNLFGHNDVIIKLPVVLAGILLILVFYLFAIKFVTPVFALFGSMLIAFNPYLTYLSRFLRDYSLKIFFFFISLLLLASLLKQINRLNLDKNIIRSFLIALPFLWLSFHFGSAETALLIITFIVFLLGIFVINIKTLRKLKSSRVLLLVSAAGVALIIATMKLLGYLSIGYIEYIINTHLSFNNIAGSSITAYYLHYLFDYHFRGLIILIITISAAFLIYKKLWHYVFIFINLGLGYYIVAYLGNRYEDFRYIAFLIPLAILTMVISMHIIWRYLCLIKRIYIKRILKIVFIAVAFLVPTYYLPIKISQANVLSGYIGLGQPWWKGTEGATYIHRRAVAPEYKKVDSYLNQNSDLLNDVFVFTDAEYIYLDSIPNKSFYALRDNKYLASLSDSDDKIQYNTFLKQHSCEDIWFVGTYVHLLDKNLLDAFVNNPNAIAIGPEIGIMHYNYADFYTNRKFTWPTLIKIQSACEEADAVNDLSR